MISVVLVFSGDLDHGFIEIGHFIRTIGKGFIGIGWFSLDLGQVFRGIELVYSQDLDSVV
jgi:hypothetical protein